MINAFVINRNLVSTTKQTVDFLQKDPRVKVHIIDNDSTYGPCLEYYRDCNVQVFYMEQNCGPYVAWDWRLSHLHNNEPFIVADSDCTYQYIPDNWLDEMLKVLHTTDVHKVSFSIRIDDIPDTQIGKMAKAWESQFWDSHKLEKNYYRTNTDTTFSLYRENGCFSYDSARLLPPYTMKHVPFYLPDVLDKEWAYYKEHAGNASTWFNKRKALGI